jgi:hypothetical protein
MILQPLLILMKCFLSKQKLKIQFHKHHLPKKKMIKQFFLNLIKEHNFHSKKIAFFLNHNFLEQLDIKLYKNQVYLHLLLNYLKKIDTVLFFSI